MINNMIRYSEPFQITCPDCGDIFEANDDCITLGGEVPSEEMIIIECPSCGYEQEF